MISIPRGLLLALIRIARTYHALLSLIRVEEIEVDGHISEAERLYYGKDTPPQKTGSPTTDPRD